jgi:hypothetical protein
MAQSSIVATLSRHFKRNITPTLSAHSSFRSRSYSSSLSFRRKAPLSASLSTMGETPVAAVDAGMDAVQRRLMFDDEFVSLSLSISFIYLLAFCLIALIYF